MKQKRNQNILRMALVAVFGLAMSVPANAQFGGLMKKAKDAAKKKVEQTVNEATGNSTTTTTTTDANTGATTTGNNDADQQKMLDDAQASYRASHPAVMEKYNAEQAGGMDKYLGLDQTENGKILWKYASLTSDEYTAGQNIRNANAAACQLTYILRYLKGNTEEFSAHSNPAYVLQQLNTDIPANLKRAKSSPGKAPVPAADIAAISSELTRIKQLYLSQTGTKEKTAEEKAAEANAEYVKDIVSQNYLLSDLTDRNRNAKVVADYKAKINAKVKAQLAPTKILGTYSTSPAWQGLPLFKYPDLKEKYSSVQEMQFKTFYEKGGKYYVVKGAFRQSIKQGDNVHGAQPDKTYWPGLETPVEIPADKIQGVKF
ncbi:MAG: hypothetical protein IJ551_04940 [Prevotella sp.]|nr:hypothetical protein [Prevotella sp.]